MANPKPNKKAQQQQQQQPKSQQSQSSGKKQSKKEKMSKMSDDKSKKSGCSCCKWMLGVFLLFVGIGAALNYDTQTNGNGVFEKSAVGKFLKDTGALPYVMTATTTTLHYGARGYQWAEVNVPIGYEKTKVVVTPYCKFGRDLGITVWNGIKQAMGNLCNFVHAKYPDVVKFIEQYAPGLPEKLENGVKATWNAIKSISINVWQVSCDFFKTKVFVGQLSPENLGKTLNQTQTRAIEYYSWFHEKVDEHAKVKSS